MTFSEKRLVGNAHSQYLSAILAISTYRIVSLSFACCPPSSTRASRTPLLVSGSMELEAWRWQDATGQSHQAHRALQLPTTQRLPVSWSLVTSGSTPHDFPAICAHRNLWRHTIVSQIEAKWECRDRTHYSVGNETYNSVSPVQRGAKTVD